MAVVGQFLLDYKVFHPRRQRSSATAVSTSNLTTLMFYIKEVIYEVNAKIKTYFFTVKHELLKDGCTNLVYIPTETPTLYIPS
jgi:hypothetical protein